MATYTASEAQAGIQPKSIRVGLTAVTSFYSFPASISATTTIQMIKVPANSTPFMIMVANTNAGDSSVLVGDGNSTGRYRSSGTLSAGQQWVILTLPLVPYTYSVDDTIDILISTASATTLGGAVYLQAIFSMDVRTPAVT